ncbi:MAG: winged helix DNA-binding domain-containing protein [Actinobacteria bacterium]|nr:winged helix DNA-binding domain-containing protein [Actinomycetota bacterium]
MHEPRESGSRSATAVVSALVGIQAQDPGAAALSLRARTSGLVTGDVDAALGDERSLVLTWSLRGTRHLHAGSDVRWLVALLGPKFARPGRRAEQLGIAGDIGDNAVRVVRDELASGGPLTRPEVKERLAVHGVDPSGQAAIHVLHRAALEGILCVVPGCVVPGCVIPGWGTEERYVLLDDWVEPAPAIDRDQAAVLLARRYLASFGPASPADFAAWSGLGVGVARRAWAELGGALTEVSVPGGRSWLLADQWNDLAAAVHEPGPLRLLGGFDNLLLGYADRGSLLDPEHSGRVNAGGGLIRPTVLADGQVIGTWAHRRSRRPDRVEVETFRPLRVDETEALEQEVVDVSRFLGTRPLTTDVIVISEET